MYAPRTGGWADIQVGVRESQAHGLRGGGFDLVAERVDDSRETAEEIGFVSNAPSRLATACGVVASSRLLRAGDEDVAHIREFVARAASRAVGLGVELGEGGGETLAASYAMVRQGGRLVSLADEPDGTAAEAHGIHACSQFVEPSGEKLERIAQLFDAHQLETRVQKIYPLNKAAEAHEVIEQGHVKGKLVLNL